MNENTKKSIVQCSVKVISWERYQKRCKELHLNAVPYFCAILVHELDLIEHTISPDKLRNKKLHASQYFPWTETKGTGGINDPIVDTRRIAKIPMSESLANNLKRVSEKISISRDAIIEEVLRFILDFSSCEYDIDESVDLSTNISSRISNHNPTTMMESSANGHLFSPLSLVQVSLQSPHYFPQQYNNGEDTMIGSALPPAHEWYSGFGKLGNTKEEEERIKRSKENEEKHEKIMKEIKETQERIRKEHEKSMAKIQVQLKEYNLDLDSDVIKAIIKHSRSDLS